MKKSARVIFITALVLIGIISAQVIATATDYPFDNLFYKGFAGYTSDEKEVKTTDYVSSKHISVAAGETVWFGPCDETQYFQLVGFDANGTAVTDKIRGKALEVADTFSNDMVIYKYQVPEGVRKLCFSAPKAVADVYTVAKTEITALNWNAFWSLHGVDTEEYVGQSSYYEVAKGDKIYFGVITKEAALASVAYDKSGNRIGKIDADALELVESFGGAYGIYCYTVADTQTKYVQVPYDQDYAQYYTSIIKDKNDTTTKEAIVDYFVASFNIPKPVSTTVGALSGKSALFVGDSITYGARDHANIYNYGGWAGRISYFCDMNILNNGVSGACITTARLESHSSQHYIYNNLVAAKDHKFDFVIMQGLFNDASISVALGSAQGAANFDPAKADVTKFADALELLFYTAKTQHPEATLGYIVNFKTERAVDQTLYVERAIQICEDWGIEYLDLFHNKSFSVEFDDGLHPSSAGYDSMYTIVANWMAGLDGKADVDQDTTVSSAKVMSYNVFWNLTDHVADGVTITNRIQKIANVITANNPDILMLQEVSGSNTGWTSQLVPYAKAQGYGYYGYAHKGDRYIDSAVDKDTTKGSDELAPILWKRDKYDCVDKGHFWGSSTPDEAGSATWSSIEVTCSYPRCINWVELKDKQTGEKLLVVNYHAAPDKDGISYEHVRNLTAQLIVERVAGLNKKHSDVAIIMGGDWNMQRGQVTYSTIISNGFGDAKLDAAASTGKNSYNAWNREPTKFGVGDFLFGNKDITFATYDVVNDIDPDGSGYYISDHSPIVADIKY